MFPVMEGQMELLLLQLRVELHLMLFHGAMAEQLLQIQVWLQVLTQ